MGIGIAKNRVGAKIGFEVSSLRIDYKQKTGKTFPNATEGANPVLDFERHTLTSLVVPLSLYVNLKRIDDYSGGMFLEAGGYLGYLVRSRYHTRYQESALKIEKEVRGMHKVDGQFERLQYGLFARARFRDVSLYGLMRLNSVFGPNPNHAVQPTPNEGYQNPKLFPFELGVTFSWPF